MQNALPHSTVHYNVLWGSAFCINKQPHDLLYSYDSPSENCFFPQFCILGKMFVRRPHAAPPDISHNPTIEEESDLLGALYPRLLHDEWHVFGLVCRH